MTNAISTPELAALLKIDSKLRQLGETPDYYSVLRNETALIKLHMKGAVMASIIEKRSDDWMGELYTKILSQTSSEVFFG